MKWVRVGVLGWPDARVRPSPWQRFSAQAAAPPLCVCILERERLRVVEHPVVVDLRVLAGSHHRCSRETAKRLGLCLGECWGLS
jgi:hypothetical protein